MLKHLLTFCSLLMASVFTFAQTGIIKGSVNDALNNEAIAFANVVIVGTTQGATTDLDGQYVIEGITPGLYSVAISYVGYAEQVKAEIQVTTARPVVVDFKLETSSNQLEEVVVKASPFIKPEESPVSLRTIGVAEIQRNPGGNRDISRVVQTLPGVTTTASFRNDLIIRGGAPNENRFYLDDVEVPVINHFSTQGSSGGPVGMINVNFIREVDFYSGAFPAGRGNALSSVFQFKQPNGREDRIGGTFLLGASDAGVTLEGPIDKKTNFIFSARRSYLQFLFQALGLPFLPTYTDAQFKITHKINQKNEIYFLGLGAYDQFKLNFDTDGSEENQFLLDQLPVSPQWNYTNGLVYKHYTDKGYWTMVLSRNMLNNEATKYFKNDESSQENLILDYASQESENKLRIENTTRFKSYKINYGIGLERVRYTNRTFNRIFTAQGPLTVDYQGKLNYNRYFGFAQLSRKLMNDRLVLSGGLRMDGIDYSKEMSNPFEQLSPRLSLSYDLTPNLSFNTNIGRYYQLPPNTILGYQENGVLVNKQNNIKYIAANHAVAGFEYRTNFNARFTIEGYYKQYSDYPFLLRNSVTLANLGADFGVLGNEPAISRSAGRTYGLEFLFQQRLYKGFYGILAYTLGKSEFQDKNNQYVASSWDARHIVNATLGKKFGKNWEIGVNWRFQTGLPFTPISDNSSLVASWDVNGGGIRDFDQLNTSRTTASNTVDARIDKKWFFQRWSLNLYLDVENITGNVVSIPVVVLDRPVNEQGVPIGGGVIENPDAPLDQQRYKLKELTPGSGTPIPSFGVLIEF